MVCRWTFRLAEGGSSAPKHLIGDVQLSRPDNKLLLRGYQIAKPSTYNNLTIRAQLRK